ncbi:hypothetical protein ALC57_04257 [Trachymyrmex cornetzi]|uniref:Uncharacterized protein n=1 Tax=Trachymyrmex cornetzi TaxID=471704 RepID=A0A195EDV0_9HYME|nr:hypothetical protein ALC57_04257 [Trachymyrmex cornetzi]
MSQLKVLVFEPGAIDGFSAGAIVVGKVTTLTHEVRNHPVKTAALISETLFSGTKRAEVFRCLGDNIFPQLENCIKSMIKKISRYLTYIQ